MSVGSWPFEELGKKASNRWCRLCCLCFFFVTPLPLSLPLPSVVLPLLLVVFGLVEQL